MKSVMDARVRRTRDSILDAFVRLVLDCRYDQIKIADLIAESGVGRSTFYEHFRGKDEVLLLAIEPLLLTLANAAVGRASKAQVRASLEHIWHQRGLARVILNAHAALQLQRRLSALIEARLRGSDPVPPAMVAMSTAAAELTLLRMWIGGEVPCTPDALARQLMAAPSDHT